LFSLSIAAPISLADAQETLQRPQVEDVTAGVEPLRQGLPQRLTADPRLDDAAAELAGEILVHRVLEETGRGFTAARMALWDSGVIDAHVTWIAVRFDGPVTEGTVWAAVEELGGEYDHAGVGLARGGEGATTCVVVLLARRDLYSVDPLPWESGAGGSFRFSLRPGLRRPHVEWIHPDGAVTSVETQPLAGGGYEAQLTLPGGPGVHRLEVRALAGDEELLAAIGAVESTRRRNVRGKPQEYLLRMLDAERARYDLPPLDVSAPLAEVAAEHSRRLRDGTDFGHRSPLEPQERMAAARIPFSVALENVARAESLDWVHTLFMASPTHRANVLHPRVTHAGIGVARSDPLAWYATVDLVRLLPPLDMDLQKQRARDAIERAREQTEPLGRKRILDSIAERWCERIGRWGALDPDEVTELTQEVRFHLSDVDLVEAEHAVVDDVDEVGRLDPLADPRFDQYGLGVYQRNDGGMVHVLVVLVDRKAQ